MASASCNCWRCIVKTCHKLFVFHVSETQHTVCALLDVYFVSSSCSWKTFRSFPDFFHLTFFVCCCILSLLSKDCFRVFSLSDTQLYCITSFFLSLLLLFCCLATESEEKNHHQSPIKWLFQYSLAHSPNNPIKWLNVGYSILPFLSDKYRIRPWSGSTKQHTSVKQMRGELIKLPQRKWN